MKTLKYLLVAAALCVSATASAQFASSSSNTSLGVSSGNSTPDSYTRFKVSYATETFDGNRDYEIFEDPFKGVSMELLAGKSISSSMPLYVEYGLNATWTKWTDEDDDDYTTTTLNLKVPVNLAYKLSINDDFSIDPHAGLGFRFNLLGKMDDGDDDYSFFDKDDINKEFLWNRFQLCGQVGVGICYQQLYLGWEYSWSFMEIYKKTKTKANFISLGVNF